MSGDDDEGLANMNIVWKTVRMRNWKQITSKTSVTMTLPKVIFSYITTELILGFSHF